MSRYYMKDLGLLFEQYANKKIDEETLKSFFDILRLSISDDNGDFWYEYCLYSNLLTRLDSLASGDILNSVTQIRKAILIPKMLEQLDGYEREFNVKPVVVHKPTVYFDQNVLFNQNFKFDEIKKLLFNFQIVYSPAHIEEVFKSPSSYHNQNLTDISNLTNDTIILYDNDQPAFFKESPVYVYNRVKNTAYATKLVEEYKILESNDGEFLLSKYNSDTYRQTFNSQSPTDFFNKFETECDDALDVLNATYCIDDLRTSLEFFEYSQLNDKIHTLFKVMDMLGFKQDRKDRKIRSSRHDIEHLLYASNASYFITNDEKLFYRANSIFKILKKETLVYQFSNPTELLNQLNSKM